MNSFTISQNNLYRYIDKSYEVNAWLISNVGDELNRVSSSVGSLEYKEDIYADSIPWSEICSTYRELIGEDTRSTVMVIQYGDGWVVIREYLGKIGGDPLYLITILINDISMGVQARLVLS
jgi:hypothetical protein